MLYSLFTTLMWPLCDPSLLLSEEDKASASCPSEPLSWLNEGPKTEGWEGGWADQCCWLTRSVRGQCTGEIPPCPWDVFNLWWDVGAYQTKHWKPTCVWSLHPPACQGREEVRDLVRLKTCQILGVSI